MQFRMLTVYVKGYRFLPSAGFIYMDFLSSSTTYLDFL
jgi:hypothetical protein